jgi:hypothetical protein
MRCRASGEVDRRSRGWAVRAALYYVGGSPDTSAAAFLTGQIAPSPLYCWFTLFLQRSRRLLQPGGGYSRKELAMLPEQSTERARLLDQLLHDLAALRELESGTRQLTDDARAASLRSRVVGTAIAPLPPADAPGEDCPSHGPYADDDCPKC